eukprot:TCONS_00039396-protein
MADEDDPYECVASGGLRLKGGKVKKSKKKKKKNKAKNILEEASTSSNSKESKQDEEDGESDYEEAGSSSQKQEEEEIVIKKTAAELAFEKAQQRRVCFLNNYNHPRYNIEILVYFNVFQNLKFGRELLF